MRTSGLILALVLAPWPFATAQESWKAPRKSYGAPDIEGVWNTLTATPLERPPGFEALTTTEARAAPAKVTERFTRIHADELLYQYTVEDPTVFSRVWRAETIFRSTNNRMFEYACHEDNYSLPGVLAGAREIERRLAQKRGGAGQ